MDSVGQIVEAHFWQVDLRLHTVYNHEGFVALVFQKEAVDDDQMVHLVLVNENVFVLQLLVPLVVNPLHWKKAVIVVQEVSSKDNLFSQLKLVFCFYQSCAPAYMRYFNVFHY